MDQIDYAGSASPWIILAMVLAVIGVAAFIVGAVVGAADIGATIGVGLIAVATCVVAVMSIGLPDAMAEIIDEADDVYGLTVDDEDNRDLDWPLGTPERDLPDDETDYGSITKTIDGEAAAIVLRWTGGEFILVGPDGELERVDR